MPYNNETDLTDYATARGVTLQTDPYVLLVKSSDWLETQAFKGIKADPTQINQFPRKNIFIDGVEVDSDTVPLPIKKAELQMALEIDAGSDPYSTLKPDRVVSQEVASLKQTFSDRTSALTSPVIRSVRPIIKDYLESSGGLSVEGV